MILGYTSTMPIPKLPFEYVKTYFKQHGYALLEKEYKSSKAPLRYRCKCGKVRVTCFNNFSRGIRCLLCYNNRFTASKKRKLQKLQLRSKLYTISDVARLLNVPVGDLYSTIRVKKLLPAPKRRVGSQQRCYYNEADIRQLVQLIE